jgi:hypothetical protein
MAAWGGLLGQSSQQRLSAPSIPDPHPAEVRVKLASIDEIGEGELLDARRSPIRKQLLARNAFKQRVRDNEPTGPKRGCERLAGRSRVHDALRVQALEGPNGGSIVPVLGVVVVLDRDGTATPKPFRQGRSPIGGQDGACGELVCWGHDDGVGFVRGEFLDPKS